jgi:flagellar biosynthesis protein FlhA
VVSLRGTEIARWQTEQNFLLAVNNDPKARPLPGVETREPAFGVVARWIQPGLEEAALAAGYSVVDQTTVIGTHVGELIRRHAHELLGRQEVKRLLDSMSESYPKLVEELVPKLLSLGEVQRVLQQLLREQVSIRDLATILEVLVEAAATSKSPVALVEAVRQALGRSLVRPLLDGDGGLRVLTLEPGLEGELLQTFDPQRAALLLTDGSRPAALTTDLLRRLVESVKRLTGGSAVTATPVLLCPSPARYHVKRWLEPFLPKVTVVAPAEIPAEIRVRSIGVVG